jgi:YVTN family beta-propeller protein
VWVANEDGDSLTVIDAETDHVTATLTGINGPHNVQVGGTGDEVWVTGHGGVIAVDAHGLFPLRVAPAGEHPAHVVQGPDGNVYVTASGDGTVHRFTPRLRSSDVIRVGGAPHGIRVAQDAPVAVVANTGNGTVDVLDTTTGSRVASVPVGREPIQVAVTADGTTAYAAVASTREVVRIDVRTETVTGRVRVSAAPAQILLTATGLLLSADQGTARSPGDRVSVIDPADMRVLDEIAVGSGPHGVATSPDGNRAWVTNSYDDTVSVVDLQQRKVVATVPVGAHPNGLTYVATTPAPMGHDRMRLLVPPDFRPEGDHHHGGDGHH